MRPNEGRATKTRLFRKAGADAASAFLASLVLPVASSAAFVSPARPPSHFVVGGGKVNPGGGGGGGGAISAAWDGGRRTTLFEAEPSPSPPPSSERDWDAPPPPPRLTVILPAYDEAERIGETVRRYRSFLRECPLCGCGGGGSEGCEILVVDDGSTDGTAGVVERLAAEESSSPSSGSGGGAAGVDVVSVPLRCISLRRNRGKGAAVSFGVADVVARSAESSGGDDAADPPPAVVLVADADGSGDIESLPGMVVALAAEIARQGADVSGLSFWARPAVVVGNRGYNGASAARAVLRWGFRAAVRLICGDLGVRDSQCGFKLMTVAAGVKLYSRMNLQRWSHDVEVLYLARELGVPVAEFSVGWEDKDGSKLVTSAGAAIAASVSMLLEILGMRLNYAVGKWNVHP